MSRSYLGRQLTVVVAGYSIADGQVRFYSGNGFSKTELITRQKVPVAPVTRQDRNMRANRIFVVTSGRYLAARWFSTSRCVLSNPVRTTTEQNTHYHCAISLCTAQSNFNCWCLPQSLISARYLQRQPQQYPRRHKYGYRVRHVLHSAVAHMIRRGL